MILTFRFISDEEDDFIIDININHDQTFEELHLGIQKALNYDSSQMASFFKSNDEWEKLDEITLMDMGNDQDVKIMSETKIEDFFTEKNERILYIFDFFTERLFFGSVSRTIDQDSPIKLPSVSKLEGKIPEQLMMDASFDDSSLTDLLGNEFDEPEFKEESIDDIDDFSEDDGNFY